MTTTLARSGVGGTGQVKRLKLMMYGPFGTWKTVNAHQMPNTRTLDLDDGMQSVEWAIKAGVLDRKMEDIVFATILAPSMDEAKNTVFDDAADQVEEWSADEDVPEAEWEEYCLKKHGFVYTQHWDTLIIDSGTSLTAGTIIKGLRENARLGVSQSWSKRQSRGLTPVMIQDRGALNMLFKKFLTLCFATGKNVVLICHEYENVDKKGNTLGYMPALSGQLRADVPKDFDEVWYTNVKGTKSQPKGIFQTSPDPLRKCRSRLGCLDPDEPAHFADIIKKVAEFYEVDPDTIWRSPHGTEAAKALIAEDIDNKVVSI